ncbi:MAG: hypothetical protein A2Z16_13265 [Chloroflexi bacterium RBG_16_54_18]|nr:MAG: hypothetical protein A2Z16_13265 [Chloroflexi bacterium RBG_16_54_18]
MEKRTFTYLVLVIVLLASMSCMAINLPQVSRVRGSGNMITENKEVSGFTRLALGSIGALTLVQGEEESLVIEAEDNIMPLITVEVRDDTLFIGLEETAFKNVVPTKDIKYRLTMKKITGLEVSGAADITADTVNSGELAIESSGAGTMKIRNLTADKLNVEVSGAGNVEIESGVVPVQEIHLSGAGSYDSSGVESVEAKVDISGAGNATVWVKDKLQVEMSGAGNLEYYGTPEMVANVSGAGKMKSLGEK